MKKLLFVSILVCCVFLTGCTDESVKKFLLNKEAVSQSVPAESEHKEWLIMIYGAIDMKETVLVKAFAKEIDDILKADNAAKNAHIVAQLDFPHILRDGKRYYISDNKLQVRQKYVNMNTGDPRTFRDFLEWANGYKADKKALIIFGHGTGWISVNGPDGILAGTVAPSRNMDFSYLFDKDNAVTEDRSFAYDDGADDSISLNEMSSVMSKVFPNKGLDIVAFRSCLMNDIETLYQFAPYTKYVIATQTTQLGMDPTFGKLFGAGLGTSFIKKTINAAPSVEEMTQAICTDICHANKTIIDKMNNISKDTKFTFQISAMNTARVEEFVDEFSRFTAEMKDFMRSSPSLAQRMLTSARKKAIKNGGLFGSLYLVTPDDYEYVDLNTLLLGMNNFSSDLYGNETASLRSSISRLSQLLDRSSLISFDNYVDYIMIDSEYDTESHMVKSSIQNSKPHVSITLMNPSMMQVWDKYLRNSYSTLEFNKKTGWNEIANRYTKMK